MTIETLAAKRKAVRTGALFGIVLMLTIIFGGYHFISPIPGTESPIGRFSLASLCSVFAALPLFLGVALVGNGRFFSDAIDPLQGAESQRMKVYGRYLTNTLEQVVLFIIAIYGLALYLTAQQSAFLPALTINFLAARVLFLVGYLKDPLRRAPGFAMTFYPTVFCLAYVIYRFLADGLPPGSLSQVP